MRLRHGCHSGLGQDDRNAEIALDVIDGRTFAGIDPQADLRHLAVGLRNGLRKMRAAVAGAIPPGRLLREGFHNGDAQRP